MAKPALYDVDKSLTEVFFRLSFIHHPKNRTPMPMAMPDVISPKAYESVIPRLRVYQYDSIETLN